MSAVLPPVRQHPRGMWSPSIPLQDSCYFLFLVRLMFWVASLPTAPGFPMPNANPLFQFDGQVRLRHLYTANEQTHLHLEISSDGTVRGSRYQNTFSLMELKAVKQGIIRIFAKKASRFLCMNPDGHLYGSLSYSEEACNFREIILRDGYNVYYSEIYNIPISLSLMEDFSRGHQLPPFSQFLPLVNKIPLEPTFVDYEAYDQEHNIESADPFNMMGQNPGLMSPSFAFR